MDETDRENDDDYEFDDPENLPCTFCGGEGLEENDDPIQRGPEEFLKCSSCGGSGKRKDMTIW